jgi:diaminopimelate decarboxylase
MTDTGILSWNGGDLQIMGHPLSYWSVNRAPLPLHLLSAAKVRSNLISYRDIFHNHYQNGSIRFAAKACTHPELLRIIRDEGAGADVTSPYETECALEAGIDPRELDINGNCKEDSLIEGAIARDMLLVADCIEEFLYISTIAGRMEKNPRVILRISGYDMERVTAEEVFTAGRWSKFGTPLKDVPAFLETLEAHPHIQFLGFHTHIGSQITEISPYRLVLGKLVEMGLLLKEKRGRCEIINIGGGFPVSYLSESAWEELKKHVREGYDASMNGDFSKVFEWGNKTGGFKTDQAGKLMEESWSGEAYYSHYAGAEMMRALLVGHTVVRGKEMPVKEALALLEEPMLVIEPGRSIVEDAGITLARVSHVRTVAGGHNLVTLEMGVTSLCDVLLENIPNRWEIASDYGRREPDPFWTFIAGNLCFSGDMLARFKQKLQRRPVRGEVMIVHDTGAYTSHFMASNANSFARPSRLLVLDDGSVKVMKARDTYREIFEPAG